MDETPIRPGQPLAGFPPSGPLTPVSRSAVNWTAAGGAASIVGALIGLTALALPWVTVRALFVEQGFSLTDLMDVGEQFQESGTLTIVAGVVLMAVLMAALAGIVSGIVCLATAGTTARAAAIGAVATGTVLCQTAVLFSLYIMLGDNNAWVSASPSLGVAATFAGGIVMVAGGVAGIAHSLMVANGRGDRPPGPAPSPPPRTS